MLAQHANNLHFRKPGSLHLSVHQETDSNFNSRKSAGAGQDHVGALPFWV
jgi:hypothetical protein